VVQLERAKIGEELLMVLNGDRSMKFLFPIGWIPGGKCNYLVSTFICAFHIVELLLVLRKHC
jgi:hypothetical protein